MGKKLQMIQIAFAYMGKPVVFNRIMGRYPDMQMLLEYAKSNTTQALTGGDGVIKTNKTIVLESPDTIRLEFVRTRQITAADFELIQHLSRVIRTECDYTYICGSLGVPLEYGPLAIPKYGMWMVQMEVTLMKFFARYTSYLFKMANVRTALNACRYLTYCDETLVSLGHRILAIHNYASVHNLPNRESSADTSFSLERRGNGSPRPSRDIQDSAEDCVEANTEQTQGAAVGNIENNSDRNSPPCKLDSERENPENLRPVFGYEDISDQIELTNENI